MDRRRKSTKEENALVQAAKEEVLPGYEEYLVLLQERNKLLKRLRKKNKSQIELEQKEQGFSLYVNGPHKDGRAQTNAAGKQTIPTQPKTGRKPKTAGDTGRHLILDERALQDITREEMERQREEKLRAKTAPNARERRRNWDMNSVEIKTTTGDRRKVKAPDILTGRYDDDFESDENSDQLRSSASENSEEETTNKKQTRGDPPMSESNEFNSSDSVNSADEQLRISKQRSSYLNRNSDEDLQTSTSKHNKKSQPKRTRRKGRPPDPESDSDSGGHNEKLLLSMSELKKLRHNLSMNQTIRQSIAAEVSSEDEEYEPESPIAEVDEDILSDDSLSQDESPRRDYSKPLVKPQDTIVLDFGGGAPVNRKVEKNLSAARRKDLEEEVKPARKVRPESAGEAPKPTPRSLPPRTQSAHTLMSNDNPSKKSVRPLSAHRISSADHAWTDTDADASAVMAALRAENEQASRFGKEDRAPQKKLRPGSGRELPSPVIDKTERPPKTHQMRAQEDIHRSSLVPPDKIEQIMERVLKMTPKHQRQLVKMLGNIEKSVAVGGLDSPQDRPGAETGRKPANRPMKASSDRPLQARRSLNKNSLNSVDDENTIEVHIEIKSNWGHTMRLGLTEIQLFDDHNSLVQVDPSDVTVYGAEDCRGTIDLLFNGKCKSKMERNMWSCRYHARRPVEIMILARNPSPKSTEKFSLSQMKIWNFNKSINDLDQGVKDIRVFVGTDLVYNGTVEKGCGNQVFDYCQLVPLKRVPKSSHETQKSEKDAINKVEQEKPKPVARKLPSPPVETRKVKEVNDKSQVKRNNNEVYEKNYKSNVSAIAFEKDKNEKSFKSISPIGNNEHKLTSLNKGSKPLKDMAKGQRSPSPAPASRLPPNLNSPRTSPRERPNHRSISPSPNREHKKTLRSISMSSGSEASSGGETQRTPRQSPSVPALEIPRSETRTLSHASSKLQRPSVGSDSENEETPRGGITGYSSNHGVWSRLHSQQPSCPRKKKRKKWYQNLGSKPVIYQISEREEEEDQQLPLTTPDSVFSHTNSTLTSLSNSATNGDLNSELKNAVVTHVIVQEVECSDDVAGLYGKIHDKTVSKRHSSETLAVPEVKQQAKSFYPLNNSMENNHRQHNRLEKGKNHQTLQIPEVSQCGKSFYPTNEIKEYNVAKLDESLEKINSKSTLQIPRTDQSAKSFYPTIDVIDCDSNRHGNKSERISPKATLQIPETDQNTKSFYPPIAQTNLPAVKQLPSNKNIQVASRGIGAAGVINPPKYSHIRVPKIYDRRSQFEVSKDSPFYIPRLTDDAKFNLPKLDSKVRKPINVTLSKNVELAKSMTKPRKRWNFKSLDDPINYFETDINRSMGTSEDNSIPSEHVDGSNTDKRASEKHVVGAIDKRRLNNHTIKNTHEEHFRLHRLKMKTQGSVSPRKKWVHPDFWPQQLEDGPSISKARERRRAAKTPRKSKRMAARLDGHGSGEVENSKSVSESSENRPPLPPPRKSEERLSPRPVVHKPDDKPRSFEKELSPEVGAVNKLESEADKLNATGSSTSVASSMDDTPMLQKLKDMNKKDQTPVRKKEIPRWLKAEDVSTPFQSPADSYSGNQPEPQYEAPKTPPTQEEINMLIDEEMSQFPAQKSEQKKPSPSDLGKTAEQETPMKRIQQNRSKWRENPSLNLEESWGSLTQFNQHQRGRLSMDMDDDIFDEYLNSIGKKPAAPSEPPIPEEPTPKDPNTEMDTDSDDDGIVIPELPYGRELIINIRTTWGDKHYVGLTSVEIFSSTGEQVNITKIRAEPSDINVLPEYKKDPRVVGNLIDGVNRTRDDVHMWLAPFNAGQNHLVILNFDKPCKVAMIRIWNYNKSRIHSYRGAKDVMIALDSVLIFKGEIARACGGVEGGTEAFGDTILFTMDEQILEAVSQHDEAYEGEMLDEDEPFDVERPTTADDGGSGNRPFTRAVGNIKQMERVPTAVSPTPRPETALTAYEGDILVYRGNCIELNFTATWGDMHYLGLTGLEIVGKDGEALPVSMDMITANPRDVRSLPGHERDDRTLDKLVDGMNVTVSDEHMWLIPFNEGQNHTVTVNFGQKVLISGLRLWNYNKSKEDTYRGARIIHVSINSRMVSPPGGYLVRKGPGNCHFDFAQEISFSADNKINPGIMPQGSSSGTDESQNYEVIQMPCGFIYQFQLFTTWGDPYYVGLNGIELYDANLQKMQLTESNISAYPDSVNVLENINSDVRTPDKLIDGINDTTDGGHMWLAPILPSILNRVYVIFDQPTSISMIKIWNYGKNSNRGAKDFALLVDDLLVYNGELQSLPKGARGILPNCEGPQPYHTILFVNNKDILRKERNTIINNQTGEQDVQMTNDKKVVSHYNDPKKAQSGKPVDQKLRPTTSVVKHTKMRR